MGVAWPDGLNSVLAQYDGLLVDLWGVIHDGEQLYPGVKETLAALHQAGKRVQFLSNAPRRAAKAQETLDQRGIDRAWYDRIVTSGEVGWEMMRHAKARATLFAEEDVNHRCYFIGPERDRHLLQETDLEAVAMKEASFLLNAGLDDDDLVVDHYLPMLEQARMHNLPMFCLNPDLEVIKHNGFIWPCAGRLAEIYQSLGGTVRQVGKPFPEVYDACFAYWPDMARERILAVGDNLLTDIAGANRAGIDSVLITGGVLTIECGLVGSGKTPGPTELAPIFACSAAQPVFAVSAFRW
jgi:HAD superfamily hydrolase (TIGR01459 family)